MDDEIYLTTNQKEDLRVLLATFVRTKRVLNEFILPDLGSRIEGAFPLDLMFTLPPEDFMAWSRLVFVLKSFGNTHSTALSPSGTKELKEALNVYGYLMNQMQSLRGLVVQAMNFLNEANLGNPADQPALVLLNQLKPLVEAVVDSTTALVEFLRRVLGIGKMDVQINAQMVQAVGMCIATAINKRL